MRFGAGIGSIMLVAMAQAASGQPFPDPSTLDATQLRGRDLFNQSCLVCHVKLQITSAAKYGPDLSKEALVRLVRDGFGEAMDRQPADQGHG